MRIQTINIKSYSMSPEGMDAYNTKNCPKESDNCPKPTDNCDSYGYTNGHACCGNETPVWPC